MINIEDFIKRIEKLLDYYSISASAFADKIGIQRSGLSHILSGRNKPSLDLVMKITDTFPDADLYWLLYGTGSFPKQENYNAMSGTPALPSTDETAIKKNTDTTVDLFSAKEDNAVNTIKTTEKEIERIVVFFTNGTFKNYKP